MLSCLTRQTDAAHSARCIYGMQVVAEANKPEWSGGHRGLQTYLQRLLHPTWDSKLVSPAKSNPNSLMPNLSDENLKVGRGFVHMHTSMKKLTLLHASSGYAVYRKTRRCTLSYACLAHWFNCPPQQRHHSIRWKQPLWSIISAHSVAHWLKLPRSFYQWFAKGLNPTGGHSQLRAFDNSPPGITARHRKPKAGSGIPSYVYISLYCAGFAITLAVLVSLLGRLPAAQAGADAQSAC